MHPRIQELLTYLDTHHQRLRDALERIPPGRREVKPAPDRWSAAEILEHLALVEARLERVIAAKLAEARAAGVGPERETSPIAGTLDMPRVLDRSRPVTASEAVRPTGTLDAEAAWTALERAHETVRQTARAADGLALGEIVHQHPVLGSINLYQWIAFVGAHEARHAAQVDELRERQGA